MVLINHITVRTITYYNDIRALKGYKYTCNRLLSTVNLQVGLMAQGLERGWECVEYLRVLNARSPTCKVRREGKSPRNPRFPSFPRFHDQSLRFKADCRAQGLPTKISGPSQ